MKKVWNERIAYGLTIAVILLLLFKWLGLIQASYWVVFSPILLLIGVLLGIIIVGVLILAIVYPFKKNDKRANRNI